MTYVEKPSSAGRARRGNRFTGASLIATISLFTAVGCSSAPGTSDENVSERSSALTGGDVLAFESPAGWTVSSGAVASTTTRTQGAKALAVTAPQNYTTLVSGKLASNLAPLAGLTNAGATVSIDLELPTAQPNPFYFGALQLFVSAPAEGVYNQYLGQSELTGQKLGVFQTYSFAVPTFVQGLLAGKAFTDLTFTVALNAPAGATGTYIFDNLRTQSPATAPVGVGPSVDLTATLSTNPTTNTPGTASFTAGTIQIPASFHVNAGDAGTGKATLALGLASTATITCTYAASSDKTVYVFASCTTSNLAGDIVPASSATLSIVSADPSAPLTKIKAQLAYNALGDQVGSKLLPPIPTFWGVTPQEISAISLAFGQALESSPPTHEQFMTLPVPDFALRHGDGSPVDTTNGQPPPPNDPPFNKSGHLNNGGSFDAYYQVQGNFTVTGANNDFTTALTATAGVHAVVFGDDVTVADVNWTSNTDTGTVTLSGFASNAGSASGSVVSHVFGAQVENNTLSNPGSFAVFPPLHTEKQFTVPVFSIWIFTLSAGLDGILDVTTTGNIAQTKESVVLTPSAAIGMTVIGSADIGVASGSVNATVQLINVGVPITIGATWTLNQTPGTCNATLNADINGQITLSSLGGNITLNGVLGDCPFCLHGSDTIFSWANLPVSKKQLFDVPINNQVFPLSPSLCPLEALNVAIQTPPTGTTVLSSTAIPLLATAVRPAAVDQPQVDECPVLTWTSSDPGAVFTTTTGCTSSVTFPDSSAGTSPTITATATDPSGETGTASVTVNIPTQQQSGPIVQILSLLPSPVFWDTTEVLDVQITEVAPADAPVIVVSVTCTDTFPAAPSGESSPPGTITKTWDTTVEFNSFPNGQPTRVNSFGLPDVAGFTGGDESHEFGQGPNTITCTATDSNGAVGTNQIQFDVMHVIQIG